MAVGISGRAISLTLAITLWLTAASAPPTAAAPEGTTNAPPSLYQVIVAAPDRYARSELVQHGFAIDAVGDGIITTVVDADGLQRLESLQFHLIAVTPLDFPPADSAYHNYAEMLAAIQQAAADHPGIVRVTTIGESVEGRALPAVKISDEPDLDDPSEPAVLFMALHHGREHLTVEMALAIIRLFTTSYETDPAITNLVDQREIWVLPEINPDGGEYDIAGGDYQYWRKNRRPNLDGSYGVDLNRNYGYRWGCCAGSSAIPYDETYRGPSAFSEPETQAVRDFVLAHPDLTVAITFHTYGELIQYPYGYTYDDTPSDMAPADYQAMVLLAAHMAQTNGYRSAQASDLYITSGDTCDWLYGERGVFCFTFEMYPISSSPGFYPPGSAIERETQRNYSAVTYLTAMGDNPLKVIGSGGDVTPPSISVAVGPSPLLPARPITLTATVSDDVGVTLVAWEVDGAVIQLAKTAPFTTAWTPTSPGSYVLRALAFDAGGNMSASEPLTFTVLKALYLPLLCN